MMKWRILPWVLIAVPALAMAVAASRPPIRLSAPTAERHIQDMRHRQIGLPSPFPGALLLFPPLVAEYFLASAAPETVLATTSINQAILEKGLLGKAFPQIGELVRNHAFPTPHAVNLEAAMAVHPGAIFIMGWLAPPLDAIGLPTVAVMSPQQETMIAANAALFAQTAEKPERAAGLSASFRRKLDEMTQDLRPLADGERPRVLELTVTAAGQIRVQGPQTLSSRLMTRAGGVNALTAGFGAPQLSAEHILSLDPDVILISPYSSLPTAAAFAESTPWRIFPASRKARVYRQPNGMAGGMSGVVETPLYLRWLAELLHPDRLAPRLRDLTRETYRRDLSFPASEEQLDLALGLAENRGMAHYGRFGRDANGDEYP